MKIDKELLLSRGFISEKHLKDFLENCVDESWVNELKEFYGLTDITEEVNEETKEETEESEEKSETEEVNEEKPSKKFKNKVKEEL